MPGSATVLNCDCRFTRQLYFGGDAIVTSGETNNLALSKQMVNTAAMIERHYSKLTATMVAERLA